MTTALPLASCQSLSSNPNRQLPPLTQGATAYLRVKQYTSEPKKEATPAGDKADFQFGDALNLVQKKDGLPIFWLVAKGQSQSWLPSYLLTGNKLELEFLKAKSRIPDTMSFVCDDGKNMTVWGSAKEWMGGLVLAIDARNGFTLVQYPEGQSPFAIKGNAVMFDGTVTKQPWTKPPVFDVAHKAFQLSPSYLYYTVSDEKPGFECIDLIGLRACR
jgi:hypothetical protein